MKILTIERRGLFGTRRDGQNAQTSGGYSPGVSSQTTGSNSGGNFDPNILLSYSRLDEFNDFAKGASFDGDLTVKGNIYQTGQTYETVAEQIKIKNNLGILNDGETGAGIQAVLPGTAVKFAGWKADRGTEAAYYWGIDDTDPTKPLWKIGKSDSLQTVATREDAPTDGNPFVWDASAKRLKTVLTVPDSSKLGDIAAADYFHKGNANLSGITWHMKDAKIYGDMITLGTGYFGGKITTLNGISSETYVPGFAGEGYEITNAGRAEFQDLSIRGTFTATELLINQIRSTNGSLWVSDSMKVYEDRGSDATYWRFGIDTDQGNSGVPFKIGDVLLCQRWTGRGIKRSVLIVDDVAGDLSYIKCLKSKSQGDAPEIGDTFVKIGSETDATRRGSLYLTNSDIGSPYLDVLDGVNSSDISGKTKVRIGNISGITYNGHALSGYGVYAEELHATGAFRTPNNSVLLNYDGSGHLANGGISWDAVGNMTLTESIRFTLKGDTGAQGPQGTQGAQGTAGANGANGIDGATGAQGIQGAKGNTGAQGAQGAQGPQGATGPAPTETTIKNTLINNYAVISPYIEANAAKIQGKLTASQIDVTGLYVGSGGIQLGADAVISWENLSSDTQTNLKGDTGAQGPQGVKGSTGTAGSQGPQGVKGNTGSTGSTGPQGLKGNTGSTGSQGPRGYTGATGPAPSETTIKNTIINNASVISPYMRADLIDFEGGEIGGFRISGSTLTAGSTSTNKYIRIEAKSDGSGYIDIRGTSSTTNLMYLQTGRIQHQSGEFLAHHINCRGTLKSSAGRILNTYANTGSTSSSSYTTINVSNSEVLILGSSSSRRYYNFSGMVDGQRIYVFNRNDSSSAYIRSYVLGDSYEFEIPGGCGYVFIYLTDTKYGGTKSGGHWVCFGKYDQSW